jgi:2-oxoacid:acceptor oxidoreductase gamma subunit (pyruvate/2-ketoisovalerate family)
MHELTFYARGGQGAVTAAKIMVNAALLDGEYAQSVPSFGQERKGAPVYSYARISHDPIFIHSYVYEPHCVVAFDWSLLTLGVNIHANLRSGATLVANLPSPPEGVEQYAKVGWVDAWTITKEIIGPVPPNAAMLGALAKTTEWFTLPSLFQALAEAMPGPKAQRNIACAQAAYERTVVHVQ